MTVLDDNNENNVEWSAFYREYRERGRLKRPASTPFTFDGDALPTAPQMLIKRLVPVDGICFVGGQSGAGKTFVVVKMATCIASGKPFFGYPIKERAGVAILAAEGAGGLQRRFDAAKSALGITEGLSIAWRAVNDNLLIETNLKQTIADLKSLGQRMMDEHGIRMGAVVVDTIAAAFGIEDENDAAKANGCLRCLRKLGDELSVVVIPVHHYGKAASTGLRGSSAYKGGADVVLSVLADRDEVMGESDNRSICLAKARDGEEGPISSFELQWVHLGFDEDNEPYGSCVVERVEGQKSAPKQKSSAAAKIALTALHEAIDDCGVVPEASTYIPAGTRVVKVNVWRAHSYSRGLCSSEDANSKGKAFRRACEALVASKAIAIYEPYVWPLAPT